MSALITFLSRLPRVGTVLRMHFYRRWNPLRLRLTGCTVGKHSNIINSIYLFREPNAQITLGDHVTITSGEGFNPICRNVHACLCARGNGIIEIGDHTGMSSPCIWATNHIKIGRHVLIGGDCMIMDNDAHNLDAVERRDHTLAREVKSAPITIEDEAFIGAHCIVLKGVTIGARSVIGSGSVVTRDIPADCVAAGNPCKVIRRREGGE